MRRLLTLLALVLALIATSATAVLADDGGGMRSDAPTTDRELTAR